LVRASSITACSLDVVRNCTFVIRSSVDMHTLRAERDGSTGSKFKASLVYYPEALNV